jgi:hypothetical protein
MSSSSHTTSNHKTPMDYKYTNDIKYVSFIIGFENKKFILKRFEVTYKDTYKDNIPPLFIDFNNIIIEKNSVKYKKYSDQTENTTVDFFTLSSDVISKELKRISTNPFNEEEIQILRYILDQLNYKKEKDGTISYILNFSPKQINDFKDRKIFKTNGIFKGTKNWVLDQSRNVDKDEIRIKNNTHKLLSKKRLTTTPVTISPKKVKTINTDVVESVIFQCEKIQGSMYLTEFIVTIKNDNESKENDNEPKEKRIQINLKLNKNKCIVEIINSNYCLSVSSECIDKLADKSNQHNEYILAFFQSILLNELTMIGEYYILNLPSTMNWYATIISESNTTLIILKKFQKKKSTVRRNSPHRSLTRQNSTTRRISSK